MKEVVLNFRVDKELADCLNELSMRLGRTKTSLIVNGIIVAVHDYLRIADAMHLEVPECIMNIHCKYYTKTAHDLYEDE